jgi:hypothetical protein
MFLIVPRSISWPIGFYLPLERCFSFFQFKSKRKLMLEGCFPFFQYLRKTKPTLGFSQSGKLISSTRKKSLPALS